MRGNHNLTVTDKSNFYCPALQQSTLMNFLFDDGRQQQERNGMYRKLTHVLCHNQFLYLSQQIREQRTDDQIPLGFWPHLLSKMKRMGTFVDFFIR